MRFLGIDYGGKRIGLAKSDDTGLMAHGFGFIEHKTDLEDARTVTKLVAEHGIETIVVGHPLNMDGTRGVQAERVEQFSVCLGREAKIPVELWDERLSSKEAERYLIAGDMSRAKRKKKVDQLAAQIILQDYMDAHRKGS